MIVAKRRNYLWDNLEKWWKAARNIYRKTFYLIFLPFLDRFPEGSQQRGSRGFLVGSIGSKYSATNGAQMQRRNFLSSIFAALFVAKTVNAEERKLSPVASEEHKTKFDENTLLDTIKDDPAFSGYSNLLFPRGRTAGLRLR